VPPPPLALLSETIAAFASHEQGARASGMSDRLAGYRSIVVARTFVLIRASDDRFGTAAHL
jgi:hypothetical protein